MAIFGWFGSNPSSLQAVVRLHEGLGNQVVFARPTDVFESTQPWGHRKMKRDFAASRSVEVDMVHCFSGGSLPMYQMLMAGRLRARCSVFDSGPLPPCDVTTSLYVARLLAPSVGLRVPPRAEAGIAAGIRGLWTLGRIENIIPSPEEFTATLLSATESSLLLHGKDPLLEPLKGYLRGTGAARDPRVRIVDDFDSRHNRLIKDDRERYVHELGKFQNRRGETGCA